MDSVGELGVGVGLSEFHEEKVFDVGGVFVDDIAFGHGL